MELYRAQILLEETQHLRLERQAMESGRSMSALVREALDDYWTRGSEDQAVRRSLPAVDRLTELRRTIASTRGLIDVALLEELRNERDDELAP